MKIIQVNKLLYHPVYIIELLYRVHGQGQKKDYRRGRVILTCCCQAV